LRRTAPAPHWVIRSSSTRWPMCMGAVTAPARWALSKPIWVTSRRRPVSQGSSRLHWPFNGVRFRRTCTSGNGIQRSTRRRHGCSCPPIWPRGPSVKVRGAPGCPRSGWAARTRMWCWSRGPIRRRCRRRGMGLRRWRRWLSRARRSSGQQPGHQPWPIGWKATTLCRWPMLLTPSATTATGTARSRRCARGTGGRR
jgi:hypothetical protein